MKRFFISLTLICIILTICIFITCVLKNQIQNQPKISVVDYVVTLESDYMITNSIDAQNLDDFYNTLDENHLSEYEKNVYVLRELGFSEKIIESMTQDEMNEMLGKAESIQVEIQYLTTDSDGEPQIIGATECMELLDQYNKESSISVAENGGFSANMVNNGCMRITISSVYIDPSQNNNEKGCFAVYAWFEWLILDDQRHTDGISITADNFSFSDKKKEDYSLQCYYTVKDLNNNESSYKENFDGDSGSYNSSGGMGYTCKLPENSGDSLVVTYLQYRLTGKGYVRRVTQEDKFDVIASYRHVTAKKSADIQISYEWTVDNDGNVDSTWIYTVVPTLAHGVC